jgi:hypothetical protein
VPAEVKARGRGRFLPHFRSAGGRHHHH